MKLEFVKSSFQTVKTCPVAQRDLLLLGTQTPLRWGRGEDGENAIPILSRKFCEKNLIKNSTFYKYAT